MKLWKTAVFKNLLDEFGVIVDHFLSFGAFCIIVITVGMLVGQNPSLFFVLNLPAALESQREAQDRCTNGCYKLPYE